MTFYKKGSLLVLNCEEDEEGSKSFDLMGNGHCLNGNRRQKVPKIEIMITIFENLFYLMIERRRRGVGGMISHLRDLIIRVSLEAH